MIESQYFSSLRKAHIDSLNALEFSDVTSVLAKFETALKNKGKIILAGNGGSFSDCLHVSAELTGRFLKERRGYSSIVLGANPSSLTALGTDYEYADVYVRELEALVRERDLLVLISTSGRSENILKCLEFAKRSNIHTLIVTGTQSPTHEGCCIEHLKLPSAVTATIQELYMFLFPVVCGLLENRLENNQ